MHAEDEQGAPAWHSMLGWWAEREGAQGMPQLWRLLECMLRISMRHQVHKLLCWGGLSGGREHMGCSCGAHADDEHEAPALRSVLGWWFRKEGGSTGHVSVAQPVRVAAFCKQYGRQQQQQRRRLIVATL